MNAGGIVAGTPEDLSLSGTLEAFFAHEGIVFDRHTGLFRIAFDYMQNIRLIGEGYRYDMVQKALRRQGIRAEREVRSLSYIDAGSLDTDSFVWHPEFFCLASGIRRSGFVRDNRRYAGLHRSDSY